MPADAGNGAGRVGEWRDHGVLEHFLDRAQVEGESLVSNAKDKKFSRAGARANAVAEAHDGSGVVRCGG